MIVFPNSKINIGLNITEKRTDGYHNIESFFYPTGWTDVLEIIPAEKFNFQCDFRETTHEIRMDNGSNLCEKAYSLMKDKYNIPPVSIHLLKSIPIGAGLGGGSADAAFTLTSLNDLFHLGLDPETLCQHAALLGSDCPFFIKNEPKLCLGKGDQFEHLELSLKNKWLVMVNPGIAISTIQAYSGVKPQKPAYNLRESLAMPMSSWKDTIVNDFESSLFPQYPLLEEIKSNLYNIGAAYASMSGSGSTLYGIFESEPDITNIFLPFSVWKGRLL